MDEPILNDGDVSNNDDDVVSVSTESAESFQSFEEYPTFSPEGMIQWMFERCNRRYEQAVMSHDNVREQAYGARRAMLADFFDFVRAGDDDTRERANNALMMLDELSPNPDSPTWDTEETEDEAHFRARYAHAAMITLQGTMAMQLQGCYSGDLSPIQASNFSLMFLSTWTILLISYSW
eukprot:s1683_g5.t1